MRISRGFTLVELIVSVALFLLAITVALTATIGSNNLIVRADARSSIVEGARNVSDTIRRYLETSSVGDVEVENVGDPDNPAVPAEPVVVVIKGFLSKQSIKACTRIGRAHYKPATVATGNEDYVFSVKGETIALKITKLDSSNGCTSDLIYAGFLMEQKVEASSFKAALLPGVNILRYTMTLVEAGIKQSSQAVARRAQVELVSSAQIGALE